MPRDMTPIWLPVILNPDRSIDQLVPMVPLFRLKASKIPVAGKPAGLGIIDIFVFVTVGRKVFVAIAVAILLVALAVKV